MNGDERDGLLLGVRSAFHLANRLFPIGAHVAGEGAKTANVIGARHLQKDVRVGERAVGAGLKALTKLRTNVQEANGVGEERIGGRRARPLGQGLERSDDGPSKVVTNLLRIGPEIELGQSIRTVRVERKGVSDVQQLGFRQPDQRTSKQRAERQSVASIGQRPRQSN